MSIIFFSLVQCAVLLGVFSSWILSNILRGDEFLTFILTILFAFLGHATPADTIERLIDKIAKREFHLVTTNLGLFFIMKTYILNSRRLVLRRNQQISYVSFLRASCRNARQSGKGLTTYVLLILKV